MVSTLRPAHSSASTRHDSTGSPSSSTVQAPHSPSSQPCLVPVRPRSSRRTSSKVLYGAKETGVSSPLRLHCRCTRSGTAAMAGLDDCLGPKQIALYYNGAMRVFQIQDDWSF